MEEEEGGNVDRGERPERTTEDAESQNPRCYSYSGMILFGVQVKIILENILEHNRKRKKRREGRRGGEGRREKKQTYEYPNKKET